MSGVLLVVEFAILVLAVAGAGLIGYRLGRSEPDDGGWGGGGGGGSPTFPDPDPHGVWADHDWPAGAHDWDAELRSLTEKDR